MFILSHGFVKVASLLMTLTAARAYQEFKATRTVQRTISIGTAKTMNCKTHNGKIEVHTNPNESEIQMESEITVLRPTQEEADAKVELASVGQEVNADTVRIFGMYDDTIFYQSPPSFSFILRVPAEIALQLESHNGEIQVEGTTGAVNVKTHDGPILINDSVGGVHVETKDGSVQGTLKSSAVDVKTHNGHVSLELSGPSEVNTIIETHKGDIELSVSPSASFKLDIESRKGGVTVPCESQDMVQSKKSVWCMLGDDHDTMGTVKLITRGGNIDVKHNTMQRYLRSTL